MGIPQTHWVLRSVICSSTFSKFAAEFFFQSLEALQSGSSILLIIGDIFLGPCWRHGEWSHGWSPSEIRPGFISLLLSGLAASPTSELGGNRPWLLHLELQHLGGRCFSVVCCQSHIVRPGIGKPNQGFASQSAGKLGSNAEFALMPG